MAAGAAAAAGREEEKPSAFRRYRCKELDGGHLSQSTVTQFLPRGLFCQYVLVPMLRYFTQSEKSQKPYKSTKLTQAMILKFLKTFLKYQIKVDAPKTPLEKH